MSELTITTAGSVQTATSGFDKRRRRVIRVTPTLSESAYANHDVFFNATEIPNAVSERGGCSKLLGITILNEDDASHDFDIIFMQVQTNLGTINEDVGHGSLWTNALAKAAKVLGIMTIDWSAKSTDLVNNQVWTSYQSGQTDGDSGNNLPILLQAEANSTSVYMAAVSRSGTPEAAADDYEFILGIEY